MKYTVTLAVRITGVEGSSPHEIMELAKLKWLKTLKDTPTGEALKLITVTQIDEEDRAGKTKEEFFDLDARNKEEVVDEETTPDLQSSDDY